MTLWVNCASVTVCDHHFEFQTLGFCESMPLSNLDQLGGDGNS